MVRAFYEIKLEQQPAFYPLNNTPGVNDHTFSNLTDGIQYGVAYTVEVRDTVTGCIYLQEIPPIEGPSPLDVLPVQILQHVIQTSTVNFLFNYRTL